MKWMLPFLPKYLKIKSWKSGRSRFPIALLLPAGCFGRKSNRERCAPIRSKQYSIHYSLIPGIKAGNDLPLSDGRIVPNSELTTPPPSPLAYAFCSDTAPSQAVVEIIRGVDLLYHEATFTSEHTEEAAVSFHSTAAQAATIAAKAGVGRLLLGHFSSRYGDTVQLLAEARAIFEKTEAAEPGMQIEIGGERR